MESIKTNDGLPEGISLQHIKTDKFKTFTCSMVLRNKLTREDVTLNALLPMILRRGTAKYKDIKSIQTKQEELYGAIFETNIIKKGTEQLIQFYIECLDGDENAKEALLFLKEASLNPLIENGKFVQKYVDTEKQNLKNKINSRLNDKKEYAKLRCIEEMYKNDPFGIYGDGYIDDVDTISETRLIESYNNMLRNAPIEFIVTGNAKTEKLLSYIQKFFDFERSYKAIEPVPYVDNEKINMDKQNLNEVVEEMSINQGKLCIGIQTYMPNTGDEFYHLQLANQIFGGNTESKLFVNVREKEGLCYYASSFIYRFKSMIMVESGIDKKKYEKAKDLILEQLEAVKNGDFSDRDFEKSKDGLIRKIKATLDYQSRIMDFTLAQQMLNDRDDIDSVIRRIQNTTKKDCIKSFEKAKADTCYFLAPNSI